MDLEFQAQDLPISEVSVSWKDVKKIYRSLTAAVRDQREREIDALIKPDDKSDEDWATYIEDLRAKAFVVSVTIFGKDGSNLFGADESLFDSPNLPDVISRVYMTNTTYYRQFIGFDPTNKFELTFDFGPQKLGNFSAFTSAIQNASVLKAYGTEKAWIAQVEKAVSETLNNRKTKRGFLNGEFAYDAGVLFIGLPLGFYVCSRLSDTFESWFGVDRIFLISALYVYTVLMVLWVYRVFFGYSRWAFPIVELSDSNHKSGTHRKWWSALATAILGSLLYDLINH